MGRQTMSSRRGKLGSESVDLAAAMEHFEVHNRTEGKSPKTVEWYSQVLGMLRRWLERTGEPTTLVHIDELVVRRFILDLQERPGTKSATVSSHTMYNRVNAVRSFFGWLHRQGYTEEHVLRGLRLPKLSQLVIEPLSPSEIERILGSINPGTALGARNTAMVSLMLDTGLRLSEVTGLKDKDVHIEDQYLKAMGKGSKERVVSFGASCQRAVLEYRHRFRGEPAHPRVEELFLSIDGHPLSAQALRSLVKRLATSSGVTRLHCHLLRHTYATMFLLNGGDVFLLKQNLGHSTLAMVERYLHVAAQTAAALSQGFSPLDRLELSRDRRFRHRARRVGQLGTDSKIYPNAGRRAS